MPDIEPLTEVIRELGVAWRTGRPASAEELLERHPDLRGDSEAAVRLIYEEICLRQEAGQVDASVKVMARFPEYQTRLELLLKCHRLLVLDEPKPGFPAVNEQLGEFRILAELGRGSFSRVFIASQPVLADRPIVLKLTPPEGFEHLSLARLQHAHIVPLYLVQEFTDRNLWGLCMPYLGGLTFADLLQKLADRPVGQRRGQDFLDVLERQVPLVPLGMSPPVTRRQFLARASFSQTVCWLGACLADALQYALERGLVHFDVKPANVLIAADGQPMLLDFNLAQGPLVAGESPAAGLGGTPGYMAPEQEQAMSAVREGRPLTVGVDGRADIYALGLVLYEALGGPVPRPADFHPVQLLKRNPQVSIGLADILARCLAEDPARRYASAADLAADLRRHLADLPLQGVPNRSLTERWRKWRSRRPGSLLMAVLVFIAILALAGLTWGRAVTIRQRLREAQADLLEGQSQLRQRQHVEAIRSLTRAATSLNDIPFQSELASAIDESLRQAHRIEEADRLHHLAERLRFLCGAETPPRQEVLRLDGPCRDCWEVRALFAKPPPIEADEVLEAQIRNDLRDMAVLWPDLRARTAPREEMESQRQSAMQTLKEAETLLGLDPIFSREQEGYMVGPQQPWSAELFSASASSGRAWELFAWGRLLLRTGDLSTAASTFDQVLDERPNDFWSHFYRGTCCYRLRDRQGALAHFHVCVALAPDSAECFFNRGAAYDAANQPERALQDYNHALRLDPKLARAALNRGLIHFQAKRYSVAEDDIRQALDKGVDAATAYYDLALIARARGDMIAARTNVKQALRENPEYKQAHDLAATLEKLPQQPLSAHSLISGPGTYGQSNTSLRGIAK